jgi:hypothetical protein
MSQKMICTLPTERSFEEFLEAYNLAGGSSISNDLRVSIHYPHLGSMDTCWQEFDTNEDRLQHYLFDHPMYMKRCRKDRWASFRNKELV